MRYRVFVLFLIFLTELVACRQEGDSESSTVEQDAEAESEAVDSRPAPTRPAPGGATILVDGQLVAVNPDLALGFATTGRLEAIHVAAGDRVTAGDLIATLDDTALREAIADAQLQVGQADNGLAQAQLSLDILLAWEPDSLAITVAEANLEAAQSARDNAVFQNNIAGNNITTAQIGIEQAERALADAQTAYNKAWEPARDWELDDPFRADFLKAERVGTERAVQDAEDGLEVARANYNLAFAGTSTSAVSDADAATISARRTLSETLLGPKESELDAAGLQVTQAELALEQARLNLAKAEQALEQAHLTAPWAGTILTIDTAPGALVGGGSPIVTLVDTEQVEFHTTNLSERDLAQVEPGQSVQITLKAYPSQPLNGFVRRIVPQATGAISDAATFTAVITLESTELDLLPGLTGRAEIQRDANGS